MIIICFVTGWLNPRKCAPLIVAANRDERYERGGEPPSFAEGESYSYLAPRDPVAGGTWIGINSAGLLVALTNGDETGEYETSRGNIVAKLLGEGGSIGEGREMLEEIQLSEYEDFSLVLIDPREKLFFTAEENEGTFQMQEEGSFFLSNLANLEIFSAGEVMKFPWGSHSGEAKAERLRGRLQNFCRQHRPFREHGELCRHGDDFGTVSSTIIILDFGRDRLVYDFAAGAPCETTYYSVDIPEEFEESFFDSWRGGFSSSQLSC